MLHDLALSGYSLGLQSEALPLLEIRPRMTVKRIQEAVAEYYDIHPAHMTGEARDHEYAHPRQLAMFLCREMLGRSKADIGRRFGGRDHTTVIHALKRVADRLRDNSDLRDDIAAIKASLRENTTNRSLIPSFPNNTSWRVAASESLPCSMEQDKNELVA